MLENITSSFTYNYKNINEVLNIIFASNNKNSNIFNVDIIDFLIYLFLFIFIIFIIYIIYPTIILQLALYEKKKWILAKKKMLNKIKIQKDIEEEIEKELKI